MKMEQLVGSDRNARLFGTNAWWKRKRYSVNDSMKKVELCTIFDLSNRGIDHVDSYRVLFWPDWAYIGDDFYESIQTGAICGPDRNGTRLYIHPLNQIYCPVCNLHIWGVDSFEDAVIKCQCRYIDVVQSFSFALILDRICDILYNNFKFERICR